VAEREYVIQKYLDVLDDALKDTVRNSNNKQSLTLEEWLAKQEEDADDGANVELGDIDMGDDDDDAKSDDSADNRAIYNPLKLPLGWDGKPIPYWLYKLHGLGKEYKCEICGNYTYWGRKAFEEHFSGWRHARGLRVLNIPNTTHFKNVTKI